MLRSRATSSVSLPKPLVAGLGLASRAPHALTELGLRLPSLAFGAVQEARARYDEYARVGAELLGKTSDDRGTDELVDNPSLYAVREDLAEGLTEDELADDDLAEGPAAGFATVEDDDDDRDSAAPDEVEPAGFAPTPAGGRGGAQAIARAARDRAHAPATAPTAADLPIENYDGLTMPQVRARLSRLSVAQVELLRDYESTHGRRLPILTMLENRLSKLTSDKPTSGNPTSGNPSSGNPSSGNPSSGKLTSGRLASED